MALSKLYKYGSNLAKSSVILFVFLTLYSPPSAGAMTIETTDGRISLNGYLDLQYTYMGKMPMQMGVGPIMAGTTVSSLDQDRMNLILRTDYERYTAQVNLQSRRGFETGFDPTGTAEGHGEFSVFEAFGEYQDSGALSVRGGVFLVPFGIYNEIRYATALFAPVVLATMYDPPPNYAMSGGLDHLVPDRGNLMVKGTLGQNNVRFEYAAYTGSGDLAPSGRDENKNKAVGAHLALGMNQQRISISAYHAKDQDSGYHTNLSASLDLNAGRLNLQGEVLTIETSETADVLSYYARLSYKVGATTPFVGYDYLEDKGNVIYGEGMERWSAGVGRQLTSSLLLKAEYHYHEYGEPSVPAAANKTHMARVAVIMVF